MKPYYEQDGITIYHGDCREVLPGVDAPVGLLLTDPPWGVGTNTDASRFTAPAVAWWSNSDRSTVRHNTNIPVAGDLQPFDPSHLLCYSRAIIWGGHCFADRLPPSPGWLVWDKRHGIESSKWPLSDAELAWTNVCRGIRVFRHRWCGLLRESEREERYHPTQKPVSLMSWCICKYAASGVVLDPYAGSGPTLVAAKISGRRAIGIEIEERYCEIAANRLAQGVLFGAEREICPQPVGRR